MADLMIGVTNTVLLMTLKLQAVHFQGWNFCLMSRRGTRLEGSGSEQEVDDVAFVRLHPVQLVGADFTDVQAIDVGRVEQLLGPLWIFRQAGTHQRAADLF